MPAAVLRPSDRTTLVWETRFVLLAFLYSAITTAVIVLAQAATGGSALDVFDNVVSHHNALNLALGLLDYLGVAAMLPLTLYLLWRTGQSPREVGFQRPRWTDAGPILGLLAACYLSSFVVAAVLGPAVEGHSAFAGGQDSNTHWPHYYVGLGLAIAAITAVSEEVMLNGYLMTRLAQIGWTPRNALVLSVLLRTSYHVYQGVFALGVIPFGYLLTRSYQKHRSLVRPIAVHFLYDAILFTVYVLAP